MDVHYPNEIREFTSKEKVIKEKIVVNKKDLKRFYPVIYEKYLVKLTPRLIIR